ncbi:MAG: YjbF family lipoprotein, partial [Alkalimonas sp.]|nr:YjbF family lipoprotein [Alkalimonas sp.]
MLIYTRFFFLALALLLTACSSTQYAYLDSLKLALHKADDVTLSLLEVQQAEHDLIYIRVDDKPRATMVLAYLENGQHKWLSSDDVLL